MHRAMARRSDSIYIAVSGGALLGVRVAEEEVARRWHMVASHSTHAVARGLVAVLALMTGALSAHAGSCSVKPLTTDFSPPLVPADQFYVANRSNVITHYDFSAGAASHITSGRIVNLAPDASIAGTSTKLALVSKNNHVGMATDGHGNLYVAQPNLNTLHVYAKPPCVNGICANPYDEAPIVLSGLNRPAGVAFDRNSNVLYVANRGNNTVTVYQVSIGSTGVPTFPPKPTRTLTTGLSGPLGLALSGNYLYVANKGSNTIAVYTLSSDTPHFNDTLPYLTGPLGITLNTAGTRLYVADNGGGVTTGASVSVYQVDANGAPLAAGAQFLAGTNTGICNPPALAVDPSDRYLYVANRESSGGSITVYGLDALGSLATASASSNPLNLPPAAIMSHDAVNKLGAAIGIVFAPLP
jgi:DNA-binding beta-propeller fold protein YncE